MKYKNVWNKRMNIFIIYLIKIIKRMMNINKYINYIVKFKMRKIL